MGNDSDAPDIGAELAEARRRKGLSLDELSDRTKISVLMLLAIERDDLKALPGGLFVRGFLRAYAREVGRDPEEIVRRYRAAYEESAPPDDATTTGPPHAVEQKSGGLSRRVFTTMSEGWSRRTWLSSLAVALVAAQAYWAVAHGIPFTRPSHDGSTAAVEAQSVPHAAASARVEVGTTGRQTVSGPTDTTPMPIRIDGRSRGPCWLTAFVDGKRVIYRLLAEGERTQLDAREEVVLRIGDPANFDLTINGMTARKLGDAGEAVTVSITPQSARELLEH